MPYILFRFVCLSVLHQKLSHSSLNLKSKWNCWILAVFVLSFSKTKNPSYFATKRLCEDISSCCCFLNYPVPIFSSLPKKKRKQKQRPNEKTVVLSWRKCWNLPVVRSQFHPGATRMWQPHSLAKPYSVLFHFRCYLERLTLAHRTLTVRNRLKWVGRAFSEHRRIYSF